MRSEHEKLTQTTGPYLDPPRAGAGQVKLQCHQNKDTEQPWWLLPGWRVGHTC